MGLHANIDEIVEAVRVALENRTDAIVDIHGYDENGIEKATTVVYAHTEDDGTVVCTMLDGRKYYVPRLRLERETGDDGTEEAAGELC